MERAVIIAGLQSLLKTEQGAAQHESVLSGRRVAALNVLFLEAAIDALTVPVPGPTFTYRWGRLPVYDPCRPLLPDFMRSPVGRGAPRAGSGDSVNPWPVLGPEAK